MSDIHPTLKVDDKHASSYDKSMTTMERLFSKSRKIFSHLWGKILEVGTGTGTNLKFYHPSTNVTALDFSPRMVHQAKMKVRRLGLHNVKKIVVGDIQELTKYFKASTFDYVTSICVFCSVSNPIKGLREVAKVLRPLGKLVQIEHGLSNFGLINFGMRLLDPLTVKLQGFHLTRNTLKNLEISGFKTLFQRSLDPTGIIRVIVSTPSS